MKLALLLLHFVLAATAIGVQYGLSQTPGADLALVYGVRGLAIGIAVTAVIHTVIRMYKEDL